MITNYATLKAYVINRLNRPNVTDDEVATFIQQAEADMNRRIKHRLMDAEDAAFDLTGRTKAIPADFLAVRSWRFDLGDQISRPSRITFEPLDKLENRPNYTGTPCYYSKLGTNFVVWPTPEGTITTRLGYRKKIPALSDASPTNWVLDDHSDVYVTGTLAEGYAFIKDEAREDKQRALFLSKIGDLNRLDISEEDQPLDVSPTSAVV